jgi:hypothetical protein
LAGEIQGLVGWKLMFVQVYRKRRGLPTKPAQKYGQAKVSIIVALPQDRQQAYKMSLNHGRCTYLLVQSKPHAVSNSLGMVTAGALL